MNIEATLDILSELGNRISEGKKYTERVGNALGFNDGSSNSIAPHIASEAVAAVRLPDYDLNSDETPSVISSIGKKIRNILS